LRSSSTHRLKLATIRSIERLKRALSLANIVHVHSGRHSPADRCVVLPPMAPGFLKQWSIE
jgi:hypothetical protein